MLLMLADAAPAAVAGFDWATVAPAISAIGSTGLAVWLAVYTQTTTLPNQQKEHRAAIKEIVDGFAETVKTMVEAHGKMVDRLVQEMKDQRDAIDRWRSGQVAH